MKLWGLEWNALDSYFEFVEQSSSPDTPQANDVRLYAKDSSGTSTLCYKNDAGTEVCLPTSGSFVTGTGAANRLAYWNGTSSIAANAALTQGRVMFPDSSGLPTGSANLFWDNSNSRLGIGTASPSYPLETFGDVGNSYTSGQTYVTTRRPGDLRLMDVQSQTSGAPFQMEWYTKDGDGTDNIGLNIFAKGLPSNLTDLEALQIYYDASAPKWIIGSANNGSGTVRPLYLYTGANTSQLVLTADGNNAMAGHLTIGGGSTASELRFLEPSGGGTSYAAIKAPALAANYTLTLPVDDGAANQVLQTDGSGVLSWVANGGTNTLLDGTVHTDTLASTVTRGDIIYGNSTPKWARLAKGSAGAFLRGDGTDTMWSTLILPNAATANYIPYATGSNTWGESANLQYDGTDFIIGSGTRARMSGQNRFRHLNTMVKVRGTANQTISTGTNTTLTWNTDVFDTDALHDTGANTSKLTAALTGKYLVGAEVQWAGDSSGTYRQGAIYLNGSILAVLGTISPTGTATPVQTSTMILSLTAADYVEIVVNHDASGNLDVVRSVEANSSFWMVYLGE